jgi:CHASE3 domain sensor protein
MIQSDVAEVQPQVRDVLMKEFEDMVQAIQNSDSKEDLQKEAREMFQELTAKAVGSCHLPMNDTSKGKRQSMKGPTSKK